MEASRIHGMQSDTMIDWMKSNDVEYKPIKKREDREDWHHWRPGPASLCLFWQSTQEREREVRGPACFMRQVITFSFNST